MYVSPKVKEVDCGFVQRLGNETRAHFASSLSKLWRRQLLPGQTTRDCPYLLRRAHLDATQSSSSPWVSKDRILAGPNGRLHARPTVVDGTGAILILGLWHSGQTVVMQSQLTSNSLSYFIRFRCHISRNATEQCGCSTAATFPSRGGSPWGCSPAVLRPAGQGGQLPGGDVPGLRQPAGAGISKERIFESTFVIPTRKRPQANKKSASASQKVKKPTGRPEKTLRRRGAAARNSQGSTVPNQAEENAAQQDGKGYEQLRHKNPDRAAYRRRHEQRRRQKAKEH